MPQTSAKARIADRVDDAVAAPFEPAVKEAESLMSACMGLWSDEQQAFADDLARDGAEALKALKACKSPIDIVGVEQKWMVARVTAYVDASARLLAGACLLPDRAVAQAARIHLPE